MSETKNGFPQFVVKLQALEFYDEEAGEYISWAEYEQDTTAYLVLYTKDKQGAWQELLNAKQIKKVFGWTGLDFESLANAKIGETMVLFRVEPSEYNGTTTLKVSWIDTADSNPVKTLPKYDTDKLKGLTAKMAGALTAAAPTPASAPRPVSAKPASAKPTVPPKRGPGRPKANPTPPAATPAANPASIGTAAPSVPAPATETKDSAWVAVNEMSKVPEAKLAEVWVAEAQKIGQDEDQFTPADWATLKEAVLAQTSVF